MKKVYVLGGSGFIGTHLAKRLKDDGAYVICAGRSYPRYEYIADEYYRQDLTEPFILPPDIDEVYQLAGEVGGLGYIQNPENDFQIMQRSTRVNLNTIDACRAAGVFRIFFASSACVYPDLYYKPTNVEYDLLDPRSLADYDGRTPEFAAYPARPSNAFGWEKLYAERLYEAYGRYSGAVIRIGRIHNTYGPYCTWQGPRAKAVAAICRKVAELPYAGELEVWGDGSQMRSFTYVDDVVEGIVRLMASSYKGPVNLGSTEQVTIAGLAETVLRAAGKVAALKHVAGPVGVRGRNSENSLCRKVLDWEPSTTLREGLEKTYPWIAAQLKK